MTSSPPKIQNPQPLYLKDSQKIEQEHPSHRERHPADKHLQTETFPSSFLDLPQCLFGLVSHNIRHLTGGIPDKVVCVSSTLLIVACEGFVWVLRIKKDDRINTVFKMKGSLLHTDRRKRMMVHHESSHSILCLVSKKILYSIRTRDKTYKDGATMVSETKHMMYYMTDKRELKGHNKHKRKVVYSRDIGYILSRYISSTNDKHLTLEELDMIGMIVQSGDSQGGRSFEKQTTKDSKEVVVVWGNLEIIPFVCVFYKKSISFRLALFELLGGYLDSIFQIRLIPQTAIRKKNDPFSLTDDVSQSETEDEVILGMSSKKKVFIFTLRLNEIDSSSFYYDIYTPNSYLQYLFSSKI